MVLYPSPGPQNGTRRPGTPPPVSYMPAPDTNLKFSYMPFSHIPLLLPQASLSGKHLALNQWIGMPKICEKDTFLGKFVLTFRPTGRSINFYTAVAQVAELLGHKDHDIYESDNLCLLSGGLSSDRLNGLRSIPTNLLADVSLG